jgi:hypothetical protein
LNVKASAVHGAALPPEYFLAALAYGILYAVAIVIVACLIFERREFV